MIEIEDYSPLNAESLRVTRLSHKIGGVDRIKQLSLTLNSGKKVALLGLNGAGKSTLIRLLVGEIAPTQGQLTYDLNQQPYSATDLAFKQALGYQADTMLSIAELTGEAYLKLCGRLKSITKENLQQQIKRLAEQWQISDILARSLSSLSKGNLQKLAITQAFLGKPLWLFFDEPCQSLDPVEQARFNQNIARLENFEICLISTHNVEHALEFADQIILFHQGQLVHHFILDSVERFIMPINKMTTTEFAEFTTRLQSLNIVYTLCFDQLCIAHPNNKIELQALEKFAEQYPQWVKSLLPENQALMPLFRLLASQELTLENNLQSSNNKGDH